MAKQKIGDKRLVERVDGNWMPVTIKSRELHEHREFYRVEEIPSALFISRSLRPIGENHG